MIRLVAAFALLSSSLALLIEGSGEVCDDYKECPDRAAFLNWDSRDVLRKKGKDPIEELAVSEPQIQFCPEGWFRYRESCYLISDDEVSMDKAACMCNGMGTTMFVANDKDEWNRIRSLLPENRRTWIGLFKEDEEVCDVWQADDGMPASEVNWMSPNGADQNGWTLRSRCAAYNNINEEPGPHAFFYPCKNNYGFVCERNATLYLE